VLLIEPDGPFADQRSLPSVLSWMLCCRLSLPPGLDAVNLKRPSTMKVPLDIRSAWRASLAVQCLGFEVPMRAAASATIGASIIATFSPEVRVADRPAGLTRRS
jgi:hypothetical protein